MRAASIAAFVSILTVGAAQALTAPALSPETVDKAAFAPLPDPPSKTASPVVLRAEVMLDRARFSPGAIDGIDGDNFRKAVRAYQSANGLPATGQLDQPTWDKLVAADSAPALTTHMITPAEARGPFTHTIPKGFEKQASLRRLGYRDLTEELSEEVHASPSLLRALNPSVKIAAGRTIVVPQVVVQRGAPATVTRIAVDKTVKAVEAYGADGKLLAFYPASIGSDEKPAPSGQFEVLHVTHNPDYTYNPAYAFKGVKAKKPFRIAPGPNNPVGSVWIDLSDPGYGLHGTPEPDLVGKTQSHGCIRMTNWDVEDLASMTAKGTPVDFGGGDAPTASTAQKP